ncbi:SGNH/GDSL hydrolase family protein [Novipirellula artificiosorum]|uniref:SGNH hydrolase-type esterase domain-containing protein n=1 Tax=Novipirellula artificiosorum TaxID=2528016 RepID=A0A5C6DQM6_9BACT|nr:SGNH/GDSL hydrolase family protein [Novipirellula artificiosorum]TWU37316.1 hypothetical protein Poly41_34460 [Novipirellula artificiosorum]
MMRKQNVVIAIFCSLTLMGGFAEIHAQQKNPAFAAPVADPSLPNVLLIGDSISIGYTLAVREKLRGIANVYRPATNCGPSTKGVESVDEWLSGHAWDVIHFNFGLHDLKFMGPAGQNLADPAAPTSQVQVPIDQYAENLKQIAVKLKQTGATVIWRETTPVPEGAKGRVVGDAKKYNSAAAKTIAEVGDVQVDPLYDFALKHADQQLAANVHYTQAGSDALAEQVVRAIKAALQGRSRS